MVETDKELDNLFNIEPDFNISNSFFISALVFPRLQELILHFCTSLTALPEIDCLNSLSHLAIYGCCKLVSLPSWIQGLVSIQEFTLKNCSLNYLPDMNSLVSLQTMSIGYCDSLAQIPNLSCLTSLQKLNISFCQKLTSILSVPCSLESLNIGHCYILNALPELINVSSLRKLDVSGCSNILSFLNVPSGLRSLHITLCCRLKGIPSGLEACNYLEKVFITCCASLESLDGLQHLSNLKRLEVGPFLESLDRFPWQIQFHFQYLECLKIVGWYCLKSLPDLGRLPALKELIIETFGMLETLPEWLGDLKMLKYLNINSCFNLMYLPSAEAMRSIRYLQELSVLECPLLKERGDGSGPEWHKISHIPSVGFCDGFL